jgi:hypothetical protein
VESNVYGCWEKRVEVVARTGQADLTKPDGRHLSLRASTVYRASHALPQSREI